MYVYLSFIENYPPNLNMKMYFIARIKVDGFHIKYLSGIFQGLLNCELRSRLYIYKRSV